MTRNSRLSKKGKKKKKKKKKELEDAIALGSRRHKELVGLAGDAREVGVNYARGSEPFRRAPPGASTSAEDHHHSTQARKRHSLERIHQGVLELETAAARWQACPDASPEIITIPEPAGGKSGVAASKPAAAKDGGIGEGRGCRPSFADLVEALDGGLEGGRGQKRIQLATGPRPRRELPHSLSGFFPRDSKIW